MSHDRHEIEYCLTENGWILMEDLGATVIVIEKWLQKTYQGSGFGTESKQGDLIWANPEFNREQCEALHAKFPAPWSEEEQWRQKQEFSRNFASLLNGARNSN